MLPSNAPRALASAPGICGALPSLVFGVGFWVVFGANGEPKTGLSEPSAAGAPLAQVADRRFAAPIELDASTPLRAERSEKQPLPLDRESTALALTHRDVKPDNGAVEMNAGAADHGAKPGTCPRLVDGSVSSELSDTAPAPCGEDALRVGQVGIDSRLPLLGRPSAARREATTWAVATLLSHDVGSGRACSAPDDDAHVDQTQSAPARRLRAATA